MPGRVLEIQGYVNMAPESAPKKGVVKRALLSFHSAKEALCPLLLMCPLDTTNSCARIPYSFNRASQLTACLLANILDGVHESENHLFPYTFSLIWKQTLNVILFLSCSWDNFHMVYILRLCWLERRNIRTG